MTRICDVPNDLVGENILTKVPITSLKAVRSTCKLWNDLSYELIVGKATTRQHEFLGFMTMYYKVCSLRFDLQGIRNDNDEDLVKPFIKQVASLNQVEVFRVFHCDGLLLCVIKENSEANLMVWNPYLGQKRWIRPREHFYPLDMYALGNENNRNHKILRLSRNCNSRLVEFEIYDFSSDLWRVLDVTPDFEINFYQRGVTLKGNTYFFAQAPKNKEEYNFLICFDFTRERFAQRLPLPFDTYEFITMTLSYVREEQLSVLYQNSQSLEIWVTNKIEPNTVSWNKLFLKVDMRPLVGFPFDWKARSFFIDEEKKLVVVFDEGLNDVESLNHDQIEKWCPHLTAYIIGEDGYFKSVSLEDSRDLVRLPRVFCCPPILSSCYLPSLVQIKQPHKSKEEDV